MQNQNNSTGDNHHCPGEDLGRLYQEFQRKTTDASCASTARSRMAIASQLLRHDYPLLTNVEFYSHRSNHHRSKDDATPQRGECNPPLDCYNLGLALQKSTHIETIVLPIGGGTTNPQGRDTSVQNDDGIDALLDFFANPPDSLHYVTLLDDDDDFCNAAGGAEQSTAAPKNRSSSSSSTSFVERLLEVLPTSDNRVFYLSLCNVRGLSPRSMIDFLEVNATVRHLFLNSVEFGYGHDVRSTQCGELAQAFAHSQLQALNLASCSESVLNETIRAFARDGNPRNLKRLCISDQHQIAPIPSMETATALQALLESPQSSLSEVEIGGLCLTSWFLEALAIALCNRNDRIGIVFANCQIKWQDISSLHQLLYSTTCTTRREMKLALSIKDDPGVFVHEEHLPCSKALLDVMKSRPILIGDGNTSETLHLIQLELHLDQNDMSSPLALCDVLTSKDCSLPRLGLGPITPKGIAQFAKILPQAYSLRYLTLDASSVILGDSQHVNQALMRGLCLNRSLMTVEFDDPTLVHPQDLEQICNWTTRNQTQSFIVPVKIGNFRHSPESTQDDSWTFPDHQSSLPSSSSSFSGSKRKAGS
jgi:hypothetical protein